MICINSWTVLKKNIKSNNLFVKETKAYFLINTLIIFRSSSLCALVPPDRHRLGARVFLNTHRKSAPFCLGVLTQKHIVKLTLNKVFP